MTEEIRKAFEKWREKTIRESYHGGMSTCSPHILANFRGAEGARMAFEHQQKQIDKLTTALKEIKKVAGGSSSDGSSAMDAQLGDILLKADEALENRND